MIELDVPYSEKDEAKKLGAKWNYKTKKWYIDENNIDNLSLFNKWRKVEKFLPRSISTGNKYIVESTTKCWKCNSEMKAVSFATDQISGSRNYFYFISKLQYIDDNVKSIFNEKYPYYYLDYSKTERMSYMMNHCQSCGTKQGDFFQYNDFGGAFFIGTEDDVNKLKIYNLNISKSLNFVGSYSWDSACNEFLNPSTLTTYEWK